MEKSVCSWVSAHIYINGDSTTFLVEGIKPFLELLREKVFLRQYFFIRFKDPDLHIRLRLNVGNSEYAKKYILNYFDNWNCRFNSTIEDNVSVSEIKFIAYKPEIQRYGGSEAIGIAEAQFFISSEICLQTLKDTIHLGYGAGLGKAIQMHLSLATSFGFNKYQSLELFRQIQSKWSGVNLMSRDDSQDFKKKLIQKFQESLKPNQSDVLKSLRTFRRNLECGHEYESDSINKWIREMRTIGESIHHLDAKDELVVSNKYAFNYPSVDSFDKILSISASFIHMTNNRLGIFNEDESYLAYIIFESLKYAK